MMKIEGYIRIQSQSQGSADPDLHQNIMYPEIIFHNSFFFRPVGRTWARTKWREFTSAFAVRYLTYLFTWSVVPRGPGRASLDPSALSSGRVVHLGRSLSSIYGFEALAVVHSFLLPVCCSSPRSHVCWRSFSSDLACHVSLSSCTDPPCSLFVFFPLLKTVSKYWLR